MICKTLQDLTSVWTEGEKPRTENWDKRVGDNGRCPQDGTRRMFATIHSTAETLRLSNANSRYLGMGYGECIHPDSPASPFIFYCVIQKNPEDIVDHLSNLLFFRIFWIDIAKRKHPILPHWTLQ